MQRCIWSLVMLYSIVLWTHTGRNAGTQTHTHCQLWIIYWKYLKNVYTKCNVSEDQIYSITISTDILICVQPKHVNNYFKLQNTTTKYNPFGEFHKCIYIYIYNCIHLVFQCPINVFLFNEIHSCIYFLFFRDRTSTNQQYGKCGKIRPSSAHTAYVMKDK